MALVAYSDSDGSDAEPTPAPATVSKNPAKPAARSANKKIRLDLPAIKPEPGQEHNESSEPAPKRAKTGGAFSGFNSFLPAPKRSGGNAPKSGVNLKTSSEAAFSRTPVPRLVEENDQDDHAEVTGSGLPDVVDEKKEVSEVKPIGKTTRFMPLSVANAKKKKKPVAAAKVQVANEKATQQPTGPAVPQNTEAVNQDEPLKSKPKPSLFSFGAQDAAPAPSAQNAYEPELFATEQSHDTVAEPAQPIPTTNPNDSNPSTLTHLADDLNLTPAQRRQLFGRQGKNASTNVTHFNMDAEYKSNQELAASGEAFEHRAVKTVSAGKHSLQQLVNNVKGQTGALEDKWAEGRRARGEGGSKYGWGK